MRARRTALLQRRGAIVNLTGDDAALSAAAPHISGFLSALPAEAAARADWSGCLPAVNEALTVPTQVPPRPERMHFEIAGLFMTVHCCCMLLNTS